MNTRLLIDSIVRQTMVLIAQLSTSQGVRSPLSRVADQVFLELTRQLESQGVRRQVVADMFGMALRSYQKKVQRVAESVSERDKSLWQGVLELVEQESPSRQRIEQRFRHDGEREVAAVLQDLLRSGLICVTGTGADAIYDVTSARAREALLQKHDADALSNLLWLEVFQRRKTTREALRTALALDAEPFEAALWQLLDDGRVVETGGELTSSNVVVPLGAEQGWEGAIVDHYRAVATAIAQKVRSGARGSDLGDVVGGSTFRFTVAPDHPLRQEVLDQLRVMRSQAQALWERVAQHNDLHPPDPEQSVRVAFYVGQSVEETPEDTPDDTEEPRP